LHFCLKQNFPKRLEAATSLDVPLLGVA